MVEIDLPPYPPTDKWGLKQEEEVSGEEGGEMENGGSLGSLRVDGDELLETMFSYDYVCVYVVFVLGYVLLPLL